MQSRLHFYCTPNVNPQRGWARSRQHFSGRLNVQHVFIFLPPFVYSLPPACCPA